MVTLSVEELPCGVDGFVSALGAVVDPRKARGMRHPLKAILAVCTCAVACGARSLEAIAQWAREQPLEVRKRLGCRFGRPPSEPTIRRVLKLTGRSIEQVVHEWFAAQTVLCGSGVALDGKTLRGSLNGQGAHLVSAVTHGRGEVVAQRQVADKSNEIPAAIDVLSGLDLRGAVVTADAMHTQRELARYLVEDKGADFVFVAKDNQPTLKNDIASVAWDAIPPSAPDGREGSRPNRDANDSHQHRAR